MKTNKFPKTTKTTKYPRTSRETRATRATVRNASYNYAARSGSVWGV